MGQSRILDRIGMGLETIGIKDSQMYDVGNNVNNLVQDEVQ